MPTYTALTTLVDRDAAQSLAQALEDLDPEPTGIGAFEMEDGSGLWEVGAYFEEAPDTVALALLAAAHGAKPFAVSELPETDWVAQVRRELAPVEAGRFFVYGSHDADRAAVLSEDRIALLIEASMAFGTGHHGTTLGCLVALDRLVVDGIDATRVADIGCGTAVLAMAAARAWSIRVVAGDIDPLAIEVAEANLQANGLHGDVDLFVGVGFDHDTCRAAMPFDLVFANILKGPLVDLAPDMAQAVRTGGYAILSGILNDQAEAVRAAYADAGFDTRTVDVIGDWTTLTLRRH
jgi:ribosomal protein L11 methyltransferase